MARRWAGEGADGIHVVDLDAALGRGSNRPAVEAILSAVKVPVQVGGGLRGLADVESMLAAGAARVVLGSLPFRHPEAFVSVQETHGSRVVVALDCKAGRPTVKGWTEDSGAGNAADVARLLAQLGVRALLVTDVAHDGAMDGPNLELLREVRGCFAGEVLASGGMRGAEDLGPVAGALAGGPCGAIFGRAVHEGITDVPSLVAARSALAASGDGKGKP